MVSHINCDLLLLIISLATCSAYMGYTENTELIQQRVGLDLNLRCDLKGLVDDNKLENVEIHWSFKQCGDSSGKLNSCQGRYEDDWTELPCEGNFCKSDLILRNITEKYSGLYKCTVYPHERKSKSAHALDIQLVRTYHLDVRNTDTMAVPEFLDFYPLNKSALVGAQVVFQCRVHSESHPTIKWFRRIPDTRNVGLDGFALDNFNSHIIRYNSHTYELLPTATEKFISDQTFLSKFIIYNVNFQDNGEYACVAVNYSGHKIRLYHLSVRSNEFDTNYWDDYDEELVKKEPYEFWILFLMPLGLAMLPATVWLFYKTYKNCKTSNELKRQSLDFSSDQLPPELRRILTA